MVFKSILFTGYRFILLYIETPLKTHLNVSQGYCVRCYLDFFFRPLFDTGLTGSGLCSGFICWG
jgi:hypothetical protein